MPKNGKKCRKIPKRRFKKFTLCAIKAKLFAHDAVCHLFCPETYLTSEVPNTLYIHIKITLRKWFESRDYDEKIKQSLICHKFLTFLSKLAVTGRVSMVHCDVINCALTTKGVSIKLYDLKV